MTTQDKLDEMRRLGYEPQYVRMNYALRLNGARVEPQTHMAVHSADGIVRIHAGRAGLLELMPNEFDVLTWRFWPPLPCDKDIP